MDEPPAFRRDGETAARDGLRPEFVDEVIFPFPYGGCRPLIAHCRTVLDFRHSEGLKKA